MSASHLWTVRPEPQTTPNHEVRESVDTCRAETVIEERRRALLSLFAGAAPKYDGLHLMTYAELLDADTRGVTWIEGASNILGIDRDADAETARLCWETHLERARWIVGEGLASAVEAFGRNPYA
jgi:hypothetical protein